MERVYLQVVPQGTCDLLADIAEPGIAHFDDWDGFLARGDAGLLADADATITPEAGMRLYFHEQVIPDPTVERSTLDGGVLWLNVPEGTHTLSGEQDRHSFPDVEITCAPERFINASPPWGLTAITAP